MAVVLIRPKDEPAATSVAGGDIFLIDGATGVRGLDASKVVLRDANGNVSVNNVIDGYATTVTAAGTTTLTSASPRQQFFTGATTQVVVMPVTSTLTLGQTWTFQNNSTGALTINSSGGNLITTIAAGASATIKCVLITGTTAASWQAVYAAVIVASGKVLTVSNSLTLAGTDGKTLTVSNSLTLAGTDATTMTFPATSGAVVTADSTSTLTNKTFDSAGTGNVLKVSGVTVSKGQFPGTTTNDNATAGNIGEYVFSDIVQASAVALTTGVTANVASISLTAGDWDVWINPIFRPATNTSVVFLNVAITSTSATLPALDGLNGSQWTGPGAGTVFGATANNVNIPGARTRFSLSGTTTIFFVAQATFNTSTLGAFGAIQAVRLR